MALNGLFEEFWFDIQDTGTKRFCSIYWDDVLLKVTVKSWPDFEDYQDDVNSITHNITGKTVVSADQLDFLLLNSLAVFDYCVGTTLFRFFGKPQYPYAYKEEVANSPKCSVIICNLAIIQPIETTTATSIDVADGSATVKATSTLGAVTFSLDDSSYLAADSSSGDLYTKTFSGLTPGIYDIYVKDTNGCTAQSTFEVTTSAGYSVKYYSQTSQNGKSLRVNLMKKDYAGESFRLKWVSVNHLIGEQNADLYKVIRGGVLQMQFIANIDLSDIESADERLFYVEYLVNEEVFFSGYILPDLVQRPLGPMPYNISIEATDQLGTLKNKDFLSRTSEAITGKKTMLDIVRACLEFTDLELDIYSGANVYEVNQTQGDADDPLTYNYIDTDQYSGVSCNDVLERMLLGYRLYQWNNSWYITPISQIDDYNVRLYNSNGVYQNTTTIDTVYELKRLGIQDQKTSVLGNKQAFLIIREPISEEIIEYDYGKIPQLLQNGNFDEWNTNTDLKYWKGSGISNGKILKSAKANNSSDFVLYFDGAGTSATVGDYIEGKPFEYTGATIASGEKFMLAIKCELKGTLASQDEVRLPIRVEVTTSTGVYYLTRLNAYLNDDSKRIELSLYQSDVDKYIEAETKLYLPGLTDIGSVIVRIQQPYMYFGTGFVTGINFEYVLVNFFLNESPPDGSRTLRLVNPSVNVSFKPETRPVFIGSLPDFQNAVSVYTNGIYDEDGDVLRNFTRLGIDESLSYEKIFADNVLNSSIKKTNKVTAQLADRRGANLQYFNIVAKLEGETDDKVYIINSWNRNEGRMIADVELIELVKGFSTFEGELPYRLLEDGEKRLNEDDAYRLLESE